MTYLSITMMNQLTTRDGSALDAILLFGLSWVVIVDDKFYIHANSMDFFSSQIQGFQIPKSEA